jgi:hypothetical protein
MDSPLRKLFLLLLVVFSIVFISVPGQSGTGTFNTGTPHYIIYNLYYDYTPTDMEVMRNTFEEASRLLYNSTNGQVQIGEVRVSTHTAFQNQADVWVNSGADDASAAIGGLGYGGAHITLFEDRHRWNAEDGPLSNERGYFGVIHETGHYAFNLYDEYPIRGGGYPGAYCVSSDSRIACIMDGGTTVHPNHHRTEWCTPAGGGLDTSHVTTPDTPQQDVHGCSCWETIADYCDSQYGATLTIPTTVDTSDPGGLAPLTWTILGSQLRFAIALDRSYSMSIDDKMTLAKQGASLFVDLCHEDVAESIAVTSFSDTAVPEFSMTPVTTVPDTKAAARAAIDSIILQNNTALGDGLRLCLNEITGGGTVSPDESVAEAIILLSDGVHNDGIEAPGDVLPDLRARGVRVFTIGLGDPDDPVYPLDETTLLNISNRTVGTYTHALDATQLGTIYTDYAGEIRGLGAAPEDGGELGPGDYERHRVFVDGFTNQQTFVLHWPYGPDRLVLYLERPDGTLISPGSAGIKYVTSGHYNFYRIKEPQPGNWNMVVRARRTDGQGGLFFGRVQYFTQSLAQSPGLFCAVATHRPFYDVNQKVTVRAFVSAAGVPVAKARVFGEIRRPDGRVHRIKLHDNGNWRVNGDDRKHDGVYSARFAKTDLQGTYRISVTVDSRSGETAVPDEVQPGWRSKKIAPFIRSAKCSFAVGRREVKPPIWERPPQVDLNLPPMDRFSIEETASPKIKNLKGPKR